MAQFDALLAILEPHITKKTTVKNSPQLEFVIFMVECDLHLDCINGTMLIETVELHGVERRRSGDYGC